jgi:UDP-3-O-[3-hydroxymyristoyl] N-acetylglucosamine deacetylase
LDLQQTLSSSISFSGVGLHTGAFANLVVHPAPANTGIVFRRTDLDNFIIEATIKNVAKVAYATTLMKQGVMISTVEHLLSPLYALGIDNAYVDIDNLEVPILDGSAAPFLAKILDAGITRQNERRSALVIKKPIHIKQRDKSISILPAAQLSISYSIDFTHPLIGKQSMEFIPSRDSYTREIASARTFGFQHEVVELRKNGLVRGGSLENAVVLTPTGLLNGPLRFADEFIRHKILDCLGDISLIGHPICGKIVANRAGHAVHAELVGRIASDRSAWKLASDQEATASAAGSRRMHAAVLEAATQFPGT